MSEERSEQTPESDVGRPALEDIGPEQGAVVSADGKHLTQSPMPVLNPFWSESARDEALLRALRPEHLPPESSEELLPVSVPSPPREEGEAVRRLIQGLVQENARL